MIEYRKEGNVAVVTIDRPDARNAVNTDVARGLEDAIDKIEADDEVWVGILTGAKTEKGYIFCAGADLKQMSVDPGGMMTRRGGFAGFVQRQRTKPVIAAVDGPALAGGTEIVLACDLVVASRTAVFGVPEVKRSLIAAGGALFRLPRKLPRNVAMELVLTGRLDFPAERAHHFGLVNVLCDEGQALAAAKKLAAEIVVNAPLAVRESRRVLLESADQPDEVGWRLSADGMAKMFATEDFNEGLQAFVQKRAPRWTGK
ncbi:MAG: enoyl-CoA hydratase [Polyangiaceae bacterium UTPRO1]|jgi:enoyl-CoA hydratase|nr:crotonase/enoyl-CoA hydratase family protein [Myxococcales bacterium]OQY66016.1 MAG: enoyl-CoA hydratase [Polyangiaceae bacterium UTPRO1]